MGLLKNIGNKIEKWLFKEEIQEIKNRQEQPTPEQIQVNQKLLEKIEYMKEQAELLVNEDHTIIPTQFDIDRYFVYHINYIKNVESVSGLWVTNESTEIPKDDFDTKGRVEGWEFLRRSCGLPQGDLSKQSPSIDTWTTK